MKKRLLAFMLVAFVLCTMAISSFAIVDENGLPSTSDFAYYSRVYRQRPEFGQTINEQPYFNDICPVCGANITVINYALPSNFAYEVNGYKHYKFYVIVGSYTTFERNGWFDNYFNMLNVDSIYSHGNFVGSNDFLWDESQGLIGEFNGANYIYIHKQLSESYNVSVPYFINIFRGELTYIGESIWTLNPISEQLSQHYSSIRNKLFFDRNILTFKNRAKQWIFDYYLSTGLVQQDALLNDSNDKFYNNGYNDGYVDGEKVGNEVGYKNGFDKGYIDGEKVGNETGYKNGFQHGTVKGQNMTDFTFSDLFDGLFESFGEFIEPFMSMGINDITIGSVISLVGVSWLLMLIIKIIRG